MPPKLNRCGSRPWDHAAAQDTAKSFLGHKAEAVECGEWTPLDGFGGGSQGEAQGVDEPKDAQCRIG